MIDKEARETEKRFKDWLSYSVREVIKEKRKNFQLQISSPPQWIFDFPAFHSWLDVNTMSRAKMLWLSGTTGFGKSVLAAYITNELERRFPSALVTFFFCKDNEFLGNAHNIMRTFLYQLTIRFPDARAKIKKIWLEENEFQELSEIEIEDFFNSVIIDCLEIFTNSVNIIFFVLDGINECSRDSCSGILSFLKLLQHCEKLHILLTSQRTPDIMAAIPVCPRIELHKENNQNNIDTYVKAQLDLDPELQSRFRYVHKDPLQFFQHKHKGMFLWVSTVFKYLQLTDSDDDFERTLSKVPETMNGLYQETLKRLEREMSEDEKRWMQDILCWAVMAKRDLTVTEMEAGLCLMRQKKDDLIRTPRIWNIDRTLSRCGAFLQVMQLNSEEKNKSISLVHESFKLFVTDKKFCDNVFLVDEDQSNT